MILPKNMANLARERSTREVDAGWIGIYLVYLDLITNSEERGTARQRPDWKSQNSYRNAAYRAGSGESSEI